MRPIEESDEAPPAGAMPLSESEQDWQDKLAEEDRLQHIKDRKTHMRAQMDWPFRRRERPEKPKRRRLELRWSGGGGLAAQIVPFAALLLLAPFIDSPGWFYLLVLATAVPLALIAIPLRPLGPGSVWFRMLAPLLPAEAWLALRYARWNPWGTLALVSLCVLAGALYFVFAVRGKLRRREGKERDKQETPGGRGYLPVLEVQGRRQARRTRGRDGRSADKVYRRRLLVLVTLLAAISLAVPAVLGVGMALRRFSPDEASEFELDSVRDDALMARRMNGAYEQLQPKAWGEKNREQKLQALQALLNIETDALGLDRFDLRDPMVYTAVSGKGHTGVPGALQSGKSRAEARVRAMCHLAYHLRQLTISKDVTMHRFEDKAKGHEDSRYAEYAGKWENRLPEVDHAQ